MKRGLLFLIAFGLLVFSLKGQTQSEFSEGVISYVTKNNVYVKFASTEKFKEGDTLFITQNEKYVPALIINGLSSISCFCSSIDDQQFSVGDYMYAKVNREEILPDNILNETTNKNQTNEDTISVQEGRKSKQKQNIRGRIAVSSYNNFSSNSDNSQRMRYTFSLNAEDINDSKVSFNSYLSFAHTNKEWSEIQDNIFNGLKIYDLALGYTFNENNNLWLGRRINPRLSSAGAVDGLQYETKIKSLVVGAIAGTRPDYLDYSFNSNLFQYGGYIGHDLYTDKGSMQSTVAFIEQMNSGYTDRRFAYLQHSNSLISNLYFFASGEVDLYNQKMNTSDSTIIKESTLKLSNLYLSLRYRFFKNLSLSVSYNTRKNIIYYETYKDILERLLDESTQQGYRVSISYRPIKYMFVGVNSGYRFSKSDPNDTKNLNIYVTYSKIPLLNSAATVSATFLQTAYVSGNIYSLGLSRDIINGVLYSGVNYRYVDYKYEYSVFTLTQNMAELYLTWRVMKNLSCSLNYEGTFEKDRNTNRIYINLTQRF